MANIVWRWNNHTWWEADNARQWPPASFQFAKWVDVRRQPWEVTLWNSLVDTWWTVTDSILFIDNLDQYWWSGIVYCCNDWKVYLDWVLKQTINTWTSAHNRIIWMAYMNVSWTDYLYFISKTSSWGWEIHRATLNLATWNIWHISYTANSWAWNITDKAPTISEAARFIFGVWWRVFEVDNAETLTTKLTLPNIEDVLWITVFQNQYKVYTNTQNEHTVQYSWDGSSTAFDYKTDWQWTPLQDVVNDGWYDYVIAWDNISSDLYRVAWTQREELRINEIWWARLFNNHISIRQWLVYISWRTDLWTSWSDVFWIYVYGNFYPWYWKALVMDYPLSSDAMLWHTHTAQISYFACNDDKVYKINNSSETLHTSWVITSLKYDWWPWNAYQKKYIDYAYIWFDNVSATKTLKIYAKKDWAWDLWYKLLKTIDWDYSTVNWLVLSKEEFASLDLWDFYDLEVKVEFVWTTSSSPIFRGIEFYITTWVER